MTSRLWLPSLGALALTLVLCGTGRSEAGSFFGPSCYGADYGYQYPNRSHLLFGCGPGTHCTARHPLLPRRRMRKNQAVPADGAAINGMPVQAVTPPIAQEPFRWSPPMQATSVAPMSVAPAPVVAPRIEPIPAPLSGGSPAPRLNAAEKPPF